MRYIIASLIVLAVILSATSAPASSVVRSAERATFMPEPSPAPVAYPAPVDPGDSTPTPTAETYPAPDAPARHHPAATPNGIQRDTSCAPAPWYARSQCTR